MLLAIDIGNSSINIGLFDGSDIIGKLTLHTYPIRTVQAYRSEIKDFFSKKTGKSIQPHVGAIISSVVPELTDILNNSLKGLSRKEPLRFDASLDTGLTLDVEKPGEIGTDRIANAVAAREIVAPSALVVDFGTATTISAVKDSVFIGGTILPGIGLMADALYRGTSRLPLVDITSEMSSLDSSIPAAGKNTIKCIISGIIYGTAGAVERLITEIETNEGCNFKVVITGGYSSLIARFLKRDSYLEPDLTLYGLRLLFERNARV